MVRSAGSFALGWHVGQYMNGLARVSFSFTVGLLIFRYQIVFRHNLGFLFPCTLLVGTFFTPHFHGDWILELYLAMLVLPTIMCLGVGTSTSGLTTRICSFLGHLSYPLYMTHAPMVFLFQNYCAKYKLLADNEHLLFLTIVTLSLIVFNMLFAYAILLWVDEPLRKWLTRISRVRR
jgi:peptidoglycan/LPS O-acetylase OafA/YrhL